jgi:uncharacterized protein (DUF58 family)
LRTRKSKSQIRADFHPALENEAPHDGGWIYCEVLQTPDALIFDSAFLSKLEQLYLLSRKIFRGRHRAERKSKQTGASLEFADYRNYASGDDLRTIDWNIFGRLNRLFVKLFEEEQDLPVYFLVDASASMRWKPLSPLTSQLSTKFDQARRIAASLAYIALANLDRVNVFYFSAQLGADAGMSRGKSQFHKLLEFLRRPPGESNEGASQTRLLPSLRSFAQRAKGRGLVFILSDFFDPDGCEEPLRLLRFHQFETHVIQILDPAERDPQLRGDLRLLDAETNQPLEVTADDALLARYRSEFGAFLSALENFCLRQQIGHVQASTDIAFEDLVLRVLREGAMIR